MEKIKFSHPLIDAHSHLHPPWFDTDLVDVVQNALDHGVTKIVSCASDPKYFENVILSTKISQISATLGLQPTLSNKYQDASPLREIEHLEDKVVAIGEIGLDYYWVKDEKLRKNQELLFIDCLTLAEELNLPVVIHTRKAESESLDILEKYAQTPVLLHSFDGNLKEIERAKDLGYYITIPTNVTRRRNRRKVAKRAGIEWIMIETDAPFCATRDDIERNEPAYIAEAANYLAKLLELEPQEVAEKTSSNAEKFYGI